MTTSPSPRRAGSPLAEAVSDSPEGILLTQMLIVSDLGRSVAFYRDVLGAAVERDNPPAMLRLYNAWLVLNVGGGPTDDKPRVTGTDSHRGSRLMRDISRGTHALNLDAPPGLRIRLLFGTFSIGALGRRHRRPRNLSSRLDNEWVLGRA